MERVDHGLQKNFMVELSLLAGSASEQTQTTSKGLMFLEF